MARKSVFLIGDIGATNARFNLIDPDTFMTLHRWRGKISDYSRISDLLGHVHRAYSPEYRMTHCIIALAGPVGGNWVRMINHPWSFSQSELQQQFGWDYFKVVNDFEAAARGVLAAPPSDRVPVGPAYSPPPTGAAVVIGPGTGLGIAGLIPIGESWHILTTEGGHARFAPADVEERELLRVLQPRLGCIQREDLLSGPGLCQIYHGLAQMEDLQVPAIAGPEAITARALENPNDFCARVLHRFCTMLGSTAADIVLSLGARGGVYLTGGILAAITEFLLYSEFRTRFETHSRMTAYLQAVNTTLVTRSDLGLLGLEQRLKASTGKPADFIGL